MELFDRLLDDTGPVDAHLGSDSEWYAPLVSTLLVDDHRLTETDRACDRPVRVTVINNTGAGGIAALAGRSTANLRLAAVQTALRDPGDLVGNVARVASAARELAPDVTVLVGIPDGFGWQDAVAEAEAEGLTGLIGSGAPSRSAEIMSSFIEADLPFVIDGVGSAVGVIRMLTAADALIDEPDVAAAAALLTAADHDQLRNAVRGWDADRIARVRRRVRAVRVTDLPGVVADLAGSGLVGPAT